MMVETMRDMLGHRSVRTTSSDVKAGKDLRRD